MISARSAALVSSGTGTPVTNSFGERSKVKAAGVTPARSALRRFPQQRAVAQMHPVKKAEGDNSCFTHGRFSSKEILDGVQLAALRAGEREEVPRAVVNAVFPIRNAARGEALPL